MINLIEELEGNYKKSQEIKSKLLREYNAIGIMTDFEYGPFSISLQYNDRVFFKKFGDFIVERRGDSEDFPYEVSFQDGNIIHFTILSQEEYENYVDSGVIK